MSKPGPITPPRTAPFTPGEPKRNRTVRVALVQMRCSSNMAENMEQTVRRIREAANQHADIVCLQELFQMPYPCQHEDHRQFDLADPIPGPTTERLSALAKELNLVIVASLFERRAAGLYHNTAAVLEQDGQLLGIYRKMHIPDDPSYYEKFYFAPGDLGFRSFSTSRAHVGVCICWDQWFPEAARITSLQGAEILFYPTAIGWLAEDKEPYGQSQWSAWETMLRSHAIANGVFVAAPNRVGTEDRVEFWGASVIIDPSGNILARGSHSHEELVIADCPIDQIDATRTHWPFLRDRRIDAYSPLAQRYLDSSR
jgi:N-carbamoylputrescine amidase